MYVCIYIYILFMCIYIYVAKASLNIYLLSSSAQDMADAFLERQIFKPMCA